MEVIEIQKRIKLAEMLDHETQAKVMSLIPQFSTAEVVNNYVPTRNSPTEIGILVFNMERGICIDELVEYLQNCPDIKPFDIILANELDDGCYRSGNKNTSQIIADCLKMNYVYGLEFIELVDSRNKKGYHGNAIFSKWPIEKAKVIRLPEAYNWYFDEQRRIGGRLAILSEVNINGKIVGVCTIHLENRTGSAGRDIQMQTILKSAEDFFTPGIPVFLGGDLNTYGFDDSSEEDVKAVIESTELQKRAIENVIPYEQCLISAINAGYILTPDQPACTRRKPTKTGKSLELRLDWIMYKNSKHSRSTTASTLIKDCTFVPDNSKLRMYNNTELSDHNAVWALCRI